MSKQILRAVFIEGLLSWSTHRCLCSIEGCSLTLGGVQCNYCKLTGLQGIMGIGVFVALGVHSTLECVYECDGTQVFTLCVYTVVCIWWIDWGQNSSLLKVPLTQSRTFPSFTINQYLIQPRSKDEGLFGTSFQGHIYSITTIQSLLWQIIKKRNLKGGNKWTI